MDGEPAVVLDDVAGVLLLEPGVLRGDVGQALQDALQPLALRADLAALLDLRARREPRLLTEEPHHMDAGRLQEPVVETRGVVAQQPAGPRPRPPRQLGGQLLGPQREGLDIVHLEVAEREQSTGQRQRHGVLLVGADRWIVRTGGPHRPAHQLTGDPVQIVLAEGAVLTGEGHQAPDRDRPLRERRPRRLRGGQQQPLEQRRDLRPTRPADLPCPRPRAPSLGRSAPRPEPARAVVTRPA